MAYATDSLSTDAVQLDWSKEDGTVTVTPRNEDRFTIKMRKAVEILRQANTEESFEEQFNLLLKEIAEWLSDRDDIQSAYVTLSDGELSLVVLRNKVAYDAEFEDQLSALDYRIANDPDLDLIHLHTLALPPVSEQALSQFLDRSFVLTYAGA